MEDQGSVDFALYNQNLTQRVCGYGATTGPVLAKHIEYWREP